MSNSMKPGRVVRGIRQSLCIVLFLSACGALSAQDQKDRVRNVVLVYGTWADGSGWKGVYDILVKDGYNVSIVQEPETSFQDDVTAVKRILALQDGPSILVAHSYGGAVITEAGADPSVAGLVYLAAYMPDAGENETADGPTYLDPVQFPKYFAVDLSAEQVTTPAWRSKPSWMLVAANDKSINPDLERWYAKRAHSHTVEVAGTSDSVYVSHPREVADVIESASRAFSK